MNQAVSYLPGGSLQITLIHYTVPLKVVFIGAPWKKTQLISSEKEVKIKTLLRARVCAVLQIFK